ncbi:MAG: YitT family protein [Clostridia bacterium]|nr:YitT family protein [Clostridia bacterium]MBQ4543303.1 YitT family protein [Clostridia bacterium]
MKKEIINYLCIVIGSILYAVSTVAFIFPHSLLLGGTSGISVILNEFLSAMSPGTILVVINFALLIAAFVVLGREMAVKTFVGSTLTTVFVGVFEKIFGDGVIISNIYLSAITGAVIIAFASAIMFYVRSSSGGTDIIALIVKKYSKMDIGKALLVTDILIVLVGGFLSGVTVLLSSFIGLIIKTSGIDFVIGLIKRNVEED